MTAGVGERPIEAARPLNGRVGPHRRFDWLDVPLDGLKAMRRSLGCTINDLVLTAVSGAVREYLLARGVHPERVAFRVSAPVSVRSEAERGRLGNRVSSWIVPLPIAEPDPRRRLASILEQTQRLKESRQALGVEMMMGVAEWTPSILLSLGARAMSGPVNTIVTNVPGPQAPLYAAGARMLASYPVPPLTEGHPLAISVTSYDGGVFYGITADRDAVPDADTLGQCVLESLEELRDSASASRPRAPRGRKR